MIYGGLDGIISVFVSVAAVAGIQIVFGRQKAIEVNTIFFIYRWKSSI
jgi:hypothetical protein